MELEHLAGFDIIVVGIQAWELPIGSNCKDIALELAKTNRVLFVNPPVDRASKLRRGEEPSTQYRLKNRGNLVSVAPSLWVHYPKTLIESINWLPDNWLFDAINYWNNRRLVSEIRQSVQKLGFADLIVFNDSDMFRSFYLKELLKPRLYLYYTRDNLLADGYFGKHGTRLEAALMAKADAVLSNSNYLARLASRFNRRSVCIGQGCQLEQFQPSVAYPEPALFAGIPHPRIGYVGALSSLRLDPSLLEAMAVRRPDWSIVLVGPEDEGFRSSLLHRLPNVHFPGNQPSAVVPAILQHLDVLVNPQVLNEVTIGNYPRKIDEYLAMGKPVVALRTEAMLMFEEHVGLATDVDSFLIAIEKALQTHDPKRTEKAIAFARCHTWANSVGEMDKVVGSLLVGQKAAYEKPNQE